jgi:hypothetical protein
MIEEAQEPRDLWREAAKARLAALLVELRRLFTESATTYERESFRRSDSVKVKIDVQIGPMQDGSPLKLHFLDL